LGDFIASSFKPIPITHWVATFSTACRRVPLGLALMYGAGLISALLGIGKRVLKILRWTPPCACPSRCPPHIELHDRGDGGASGVASFARGDIDPVSPDRSRSALSWARCSARAF